MVTTMDRCGCKPHLLVKCVSPITYYYDGELTKEDLYPLSKETDEEEEKC